MRDALSVSWAVTRGPRGPSDCYEPLISSSTCTRLLSLIILTNGRMARRRRKRLKRGYNLRYADAYHLNAHLGPCSMIDIVTQSPQITISIYPHRTHPAQELQIIALQENLIFEVLQAIDFSTSR